MIEPTPKISKELAEQKAEERVYIRKCAALHAQAEGLIYPPHMLDRDRKSRLMRSDLAGHDRVVTEWIDIDEKDGAKLQARLAKHRRIQSMYLPVFDEGAVHVDLRLIDPAEGIQTEPDIDIVSIGRSEVLDNRDKGSLREKIRPDSEDWQQIEHLLDTIDRTLYIEA